MRSRQPWFENLKKRHVESPKVYIKDSGILHALLQVPALGALQGHPKLGASWEGFTLHNVLSALQTRDAYFWQTRAGAELDLLVLIDGKRFGFEFRYAGCTGAQPLAEKEAVTWQGDWIQDKWKYWMRPWPKS